MNQTRTGPPFPGPLALEAPPSALTAGTRAIAFRKFFLPSAALGRLMISTFL